MLFGFLVFFKKVLYDLEPTMKLRQWVGMRHVNIDSGSRMRHFRYIFLERDV